MLKVLPSSDQMKELQTIIRYGVEVFILISSLGALLSFYHTTSICFKGLNILRISYLTYICLGSTMAFVQNTVPANGDIVLEFDGNIYSRASEG